MEKRSRQRIGDMLVERGLITRGQLDEALVQQRTSRGFLGAILVQRGAIRPEVLLRTLSEQFGLPSERLKVEQMDWRVAAQFPGSVLSEGKCFPIRSDSESVTVAITNPLDAWSLSGMEQAAGFRKVIPILVLEHELQQVVQAYRQHLLRSIELRLKNDDNNG